MIVLLTQAFRVMLIAALATPLWLATITLALTGFFASRRAGVTATEKYYLARWVAEIFALIAIIPIVMLEIARLISAHNTYHDNSYARYVTIALNTVYILSVTQLVIGMAIVWRHRGKLRSTLVATELALWWTSGVLFTCIMAITGHWL